jgi:hypothetical protein
MIAIHHRLAVVALNHPAIPFHDVAIRAEWSRMTELLMAISLNFERKSGSE